MTDSALRLDILPSELLITIFEYCSVRDLARLNQVCRRFYEILRADITWVKKSDKPLVTNQISERFRERCNPLLCASNKWHVSSNWEYGRYHKKKLYTQRRKTMPMLHMTNDTLWLCAGTQLSSFKRTNSQLDIKNCRSHINNERYDLSAFVLTKDFIVTGNSCGSVGFWTYRGNRYLYRVDYHSSYINDMDATSDLIITGSDDHTVKIKPIPAIAEDVSFTSTCITMEDRVWSVAANPTGAILAVGTSGYSSYTSLHMFDIEHCRKYDRMRHFWKHGAGILDIVWESPHILLTCGYDTCIRKWDFRTGDCVSAWSDPADSTVYCISSDYQYTMVTGTQFNSMAVLWDQRQTEYVQLYFMKLPDNDCKSPIYSLQFDSSQLYCATDRHLVELKFAGYPVNEFDYRGLSC